MKLWIPLLSIVLVLNSCKITGPSGIFGKKSPHEKYGQKLIEAGLQESALGKAWFREAETSLNQPLKISIPYKESGYFAAERPRAAALRFEVKRGQTIRVSLEKRPAKNFAIYIDLWEEKENRNKKLLAYADTNASPFSHDIDDDGIYILRIQPELLGTGEYTLNIINGPSLSFPVTSGNLGSFWGADRDGGVRSHEGVDIFAPRRTPAVAAAEGIIYRVGTNRLGGKIIFMRPEKKNYTLYYAHLDSQLVQEGQRVFPGDTIGLVGNSGNAINTKPHLHFGIYTSGGAIDPLNFIKPVRQSPPVISAPMNNIGKTVRTRSDQVNLREEPSAASRALLKLNKNSILTVEAASDSWYKVLLPNGLNGFISANTISPGKSSVRQIKMPRKEAVLDKPEQYAARKNILSEGETVNVLGEFNGFYLIDSGENTGWINASGIANP